MKIFRMYLTVVKWHDGDSFKGWIDQGFDRFYGSPDRLIMHRIYGINAPELRNPGGTEARDYANSLAPPGEYACISYKPDDFGRPLVDLLLQDERQFSLLMLANAHAVPYRRD